jgi:xylan 1,4-beta-xylosidase
LYTEWNASSNPRYVRQDEPYAAAFAVKSALEAADCTHAYSFWTFTDIFEENYFPSVPFHGGFGLLTLHGVPKPTYRAFELLHRLGQERLAVEGSHETVDAWAVRRGDGVTVLLTNHAMPRQPIATQRVRVELTDAPPLREALLERIDDGHANAKAVWVALGRPEYLRAEEVEALEHASRLTAEELRGEYAGGTARFEVELPPHAVAALTVRFRAS